MIGATIVIVSIGLPLAYLLWAMARAYFRKGKQ